jgi:hypothetical protein
VRNGEVSVAQITLRYLKLNFYPLDQFFLGILSSNMYEADILIAGSNSCHGLKQTVLHCAKLLALTVLEWSMRRCVTACPISGGMV